MIYRFNRAAARANRANKRFRFGVLFGLAVCAGIIIWWGGAPDRARVTAFAPASQQAVPPIKSYAGKYIAFNYPGSYTPQLLPNGAGELEHLRLVGDTTYDKHVSVSVNPLADGNLQHNANYAYRALYTGIYTKTLHQLGSDEAVVFTKNDGTEVTIFVPHSGKVATFTFTVSETNTNVDFATESASVLNSFHWQ